MSSFGKQTPMRKHLSPARQQPCIEAHLEIAVVEDEPVRHPAGAARGPDVVPGGVLGGLGTKAAPVSVRPSNGVGTCSMR